MPAHFILPAVPSRLAADRAVRAAIAGTGPSGLRLTSARAAAVAMLGLALAAVGGLSGAAAWAGTSAVGEATLVIGRARLTGPDGGARVVQRGTELRAGDRIETEAGAHVHVRFVDGGLVSLRPGSRLVVEQYAGGAGAGTGGGGGGGGGASTPGGIKFKLEEGVVRSITGAWGESARERFRLNTPVAAIGVKGTDFVVRSSGPSTAASVFTGAIVVAPLTDTCAATLGPCANGFEKFLSAEMKGQMVELHRDQAIPRLVPAVDLLALARQSVAGAQRVQGVAASDLAAAVLVASVEAPRADGVSPGKPLLSDRTAADQLAAATSAAAASQELQWMRYPWAGPIAGDDFSRRFDAAFVQGTASMGTDGAYTLRRIADAVFAPTRATAALRLTDGAAQVVRGQEVEPVRLQDGRLDLDFGRAVFSTAVTAVGSQLGTSGVQASGTIDTQGRLRATQGNATLSGGLNSQGDRAGYVFRRDLPGGQLQGVTLWGR